MRLDELFGDNGADVQTRLRQSALDLITPLVARNLPFLTMQQVIDGLRQTRPGLLIDRSMVVDLLNPTQVKSVDRIEGDRIYLKAPDADDTDNGADGPDADDQAAQQKANADQVAGQAQQQAQKSVQDDA